jgi:hypothetical protein
MPEWVEKTPFTSKDAHSSSSKRELLHIKYH